MNPAFQHLLVSASYLVSLVFFIVTLYRIWPRKRHWVQGFKKLTPGGIPVEQMPDYFDFRSRLALCFFMSAVLCLMLGTLVRPFLPPAPPQAVPEEAAQPPHRRPRIQRSSTARMGDKVKIICGTSQVCGIAPTAQAAQGFAAHPRGTGSGVQIKSGTEAIVTLYDPDYAQTDTAEVYVIPDDTDTHPAITGWVPGVWMHKLREQTL